MKERALYSIPVLFIAAALCFFLLGDTTHRYLSRSLTSLSTGLRISQHFAGIVLLALGNGCPEVIESIAASLDLNQEGMEMAIGYFIGNGMVHTALILGVVLIYGGNIQVEKWGFLRDIFFYLLTLCMVCVFAWKDMLTSWAGISFITGYVVYVVLALIQEKCCNGSNTDNDTAVALKEHKNKEEIGVNDEKNISSQMQMPLYKEGTDDNQGHAALYQMNPIKIESNADDGINEEEGLFPRKEEHSFAMKKFDSFQAGRKRSSSFHFSGMLVETKAYFHSKDSEFGKKGFVKKIFHILIQLPCNFLRNLSIPPSTMEQYNRVYLIIVPFGGTLFALIVLKKFHEILDNAYIFTSVCVCCIFISLCIAYTTKKNRLPDWMLVSVFFSFALTLLWIWFIAQILIDILQTFGAIVNIRPSFLGMIVLSMGNCFSDIILNVSLAEAGFKEMSVTGTMTEPLFNTQVGLGIIIIKNNIMHGLVDVDIFNEKNVIISTGIVFLTVHLLCILFKGIFGSYQLGRSIAWISLLMFFSYMITVFLISFI